MERYYQNSKGFGDERVKRLNMDGSRIDVLQMWSTAYHTYTD